MAFNPTTFEKKNFFEIDEGAEPESEERIMIDATLFEQKRNNSE